MKALKIIGGMLLAILVLMFFYNWGKSNSTNTAVESTTSYEQQPHKCSHARKRVAHVAKRVETEEIGNGYEQTRESIPAAPAPTQNVNVTINNNVTTPQQQVVVRERVVYVNSAPAPVVYAPSYVPGMYPRVYYPRPGYAKQCYRYR